MEMLDPFVGVAQRLMPNARCGGGAGAQDFRAAAADEAAGGGGGLPWVIKNVFFLMQRGGTTSSLTLQACFKTLTVLLREASGRVALSQAQLKVLLSFARQDILDSGRQAVAFGLVRAIIARKFVCEEVYDLVEAIEAHGDVAVGADARPLCTDAGPVSAGVSAGGQAAACTCQRSSATLTTPTKPGAK